MNSQILVDKYEAKLEGQQLLFPEPEILLRNTKFKKIDPEFDKQALIWWWMNVYVPDGYGDNRTEDEVYKTWSNAMWGCFKNIHMNGYNVHINQQLVKFAGYKKEPIDPQIEELRMWVPYIKPWKDEEGREGKLIRIFEHTLSAGGIWSLWAYSDNEYALGIRSYGRYTERATFDSLGKAVNFIVGHIWYEKKY